MFYALIFILYSSYYIFYIVDGIYYIYVHIYYSIINAYQIYQFEYEKIKGTNERIIENLTDFQIGFLDKAIIRDFFFLEK